jgi:6-phosphofructokinase 2
MIVTLTINPSGDASSGVDYVVPDNKLCCQEPSFEPGGGGINISRAIKKLGGESFPCISRVGCLGRWFNNYLTGKG